MFIHLYQAFLISFLHFMEEDPFVGWSEDEVKKVWRIVTQKFESLNFDKFLTSKIFLSSLKKIRRRNLADETFFPSSESNTSTKFFEKNLQYLTLETPQFVGLYLPCRVCSVNLSEAKPPTNLLPLSTSISRAQRSKAIEITENGTNLPISLEPRSIRSDAQDWAIPIMTKCQLDSGVEEVLTGRL